MVEKSFSVSGKQEDNAIMKFNSHPYTLSLQYPSYSKFSQLSYEFGCSRAFWCRKCATWHWNKYVLILLNCILYTYPKIYSCYSWIQKPLWTRKLCFKYLHSNKVDIRNGFWDLNKYLTKSCPSWKSRERPPPQKKKKKKNIYLEIFLSQLLIIRDIQNLPLYICFWGWQKRWNILKKITYHQSCQNPRWPPIMVKDLFLVKSINMPFLILP